MGTSGHWLSRVNAFHWCMIISLVIFMSAFHAGVMDFPLKYMETSPRWEECRPLTLTWLEHPNSTAHTQIHPVPLFSVLQNTCYTKRPETTQMCRLKAKSAPPSYRMYECSWIYHRVQIHCTHSLAFKGAFVPCRDKSAFLWLDKIILEKTELYYTGMLCVDLNVNTCTNQSV